MSDVIKREAIEYADCEFFNGSIIPTTDNLTRKLSSKLYNYRRNNDKLSFLNILRSEVLNQKLKHEEKCPKIKADCLTSQEKETGLFVIDQEIEIISKSSQYQAKNLEEFSSEQKSELYNSIHEIKNKLNELGHGQQIIFDELDELKKHFNLGKKNWFQLLKGKLFDLTVTKIIDKTIVKEVYDMLSEGFDDLPKLLN